MKDKSRVNFSYDSLPEQVRAAAIEQTQAIHDLVKQVREGIIEIGQRLIAIRDLLRHNKAGGFDGWLAKELRWKRSTAYRYIRIAEHLPNRPSLAQLPMKLLLLLVAKSTPALAREEVVNLAGKGEELTASDVEQIVSKHEGRKRVSRSYKLDQAPRTPILPSSGYVSYEHKAPIPPSSGFAGYEQKARPVGPGRAVNAPSDADDSGHLLPIETHGQERDEQDRHQVALAAMLDQEVARRCLTSADPFRDTAFAAVNWIIECIEGDPELNGRLLPVAQRLKEIVPAWESVG
jgi:hypothetical protein